MAKTLRFDSPTQVSHSDPTGLVPSTATCKFMTADGQDALLTGTVTLPSVNTTVGLPAPDATLDVTDPFNFGGGTTLTPDGSNPAFTFTVDGLTVTAASHQLPSDGATFTVTVDGTDYTGTYHQPDALTVAMGAVVTAGAGDPHYTFSGTGPITLRHAGTSGVSVSASTTSTNHSFTAVHTQTGTGTPAVADQWSCAVGGMSGPPNDGDTITVTIDGTPYTSTYHTGDDGTAFFGDLVTAINADPNYSASWAGGMGPPPVIVTARVAGARSSVITASTTISGGATFTATQTRPGADEVPGQDDIWTVTATYTGDGPGDIGTDDFFVGYWLRAATQYRQVSDYTYADDGTTLTLTFTLSTTAPAPFHHWQSGTPVNTQAIQVYQHGTVVPGVAPPSGSTRGVLKVVDPTGVTVGDPYVTAYLGQQIVVTVTAISGHALTITPTLDAVPVDGSTFKGLKLTCTVSAPQVKYLGQGHRLVWQYSDGATDRQHVESLTVVRWVPDPPVSAQGVKALLAAYQPSTANTRDQTYYQGIADRVAAKIEQALLATGRRQSCYGDPNAFSEPGRTAARLYLADDGFYPGGASPDAFLRECQMRLEQELRLAIAGLAYDADGDGTLTTDEQRPAFFSFKVRL